MTEVQPGEVELGRIGGIPIRAHWTVLLLAFVFNLFEFRPYGWVAYIFLILFHELGHAFLVRRSGLSVEFIRLHGLGGECGYSGWATDWQHSVIAWGGVLAQALLALAVFPFRSELSHSVMGAEVLDVFWRANGIIIAFNLIPWPPLDGHKALKIFGYWRKRRTARKNERPKVESAAPVIEDEPSDDQLPQLPRFDLRSSDLSDDDPILLKKLVRGLEQKTKK